MQQIHAFPQQYTPRNIDTLAAAAPPIKPSRQKQSPEVFSRRDPVLKRGKEAAVICLNPRDLTQQPANEPLGERGNPIHLLRSSITR